MKSDPEEAKTSRDRGFNKRWPVDENYEIRDGIIRPLLDGKFVEADELVPWRAAQRYYYPIARPELPGEFAKLANASEKKVLKFVKRYGLLGYRQVVESDPDRYSNIMLYLCAAAEQEGLVIPHKILSFYQDKALNLGDPINWVLGHAATVESIMRLSGSLTNPSAINREFELLRLDALPDEEEVVFKYWERTSKTQLTGSAGGPVYLADKRYALMTVISMMLTPNLGGVSRYLSVDQYKAKNHESLGKKKRFNHESTYELEPIFKFTSLLDCIYWLVADAVLGKTIKRCLHCKRYYISTRKNRKYCPPRYPGGVSTCQNVHQVTLSRQRKLKERKSKARQRNRSDLAQGAE
jgi:hypothetical protein